MPSANLNEIINSHLLLVNQVYTKHGHELHLSLHLDLGLKLVAGFILALWKLKSQLPCYLAFGYWVQQFLVQHGIFPKAILYRLYISDSDLKCNNSILGSVHYFVRFLQFEQRSDLF